MVAYYSYETSLTSTVTVVIEFVKWDEVILCATLPVWILSKLVGMPAYALHCPLAILLPFLPI